MYLNFFPKTKHIKSTVNISSWLIFRSILRLINHASFFSESNFRFYIAETGQRKKHQAIDHYGHPFPAKLADNVCPATQQTRSVASFVFGAEVVNTFYYDNCHAAVRRHMHCKAYIKLAPLLRKITKSIFHGERKMDINTRRKFCSLLKKFL